ncbi:kinase-like domain-containing protein [Fusarium redolens]|uniref:Kinase-like domain-containing protein n=1 Tax=Fusarium redolens TaxID=48865 RepID=A0A9P9FZ16_FUSRE|nr:kinase-like domain-containing protein [Fusarium redolens]KAH7222609.1 kinase-like domain-containing protein [Fusarium redolens]
MSLTVPCGDVVDRGDFVGSDDEYEYRIEQKLGHGGFSTVWMAYDMLEKKDVALKIMTPEESNEHEYNIQKEIIRIIQDTSHLVLCPNLRDHRRQKPVRTQMSAAKQLLQAISHLHDNLSSANVMYSLRPIDNSSVTAKYQYIGRPKKMRLDPDLWNTGELVMPMLAHESLIGDDVSLGDFGLALKSERVRDQDPTFATDMWSYICIFAELYMGYALFYGLGNSSIVSYIVHTLGLLPTTWRGTYKAGGADNDWWYDQGYKLDPSASLEAKVSRLRPDIDAVERELVLSMWRKGLSYQPQDRLTASQLLEDVSFKALMEIYGVQEPA